MRKIFHLLFVLFILLVASTSFAGMEAWDGVSWTAVKIPTVFKTFDSATCGTEFTIWDPAAGKKFRLMGINVGASAASAVNFKDNTTGTTIFTVRGGTNIGIATDLRNGILSAAADNVLTIVTSVAAACSGTVWGIEE